MNTNRHGSWLLATLVLLLTATACNGGDERLDSFELELPASVAQGQSFDLIVTAVGSEGSRPFVGFTDTVELSVSNGTLTPTDVDVESGTGTADAAISGVTGDVTVTATHENATGSAQVSVAASDATDRLPGEPEDAAAAAIPSVDFEPRAEDYSDDHPELAGMLVSHNTLLIAFTVDTTVADANEILSEIDAQIVGGMPGVEGQAAGILVLRVPTDDHEELTAVVEQLEQNPSVEVVVQDVLLPEPEPDAFEDGAARPQMIPGPNGGVPSDWTWQTTPSGGNWGLELIRAPQTWNLNGAIEKNGSATATGVLDSGFADEHEDLEYGSIASTTARDHGTHVAGTIGATFDNGVGVDGVTPFAELHVRALDAISSDGNWFRSAGEVMIFSFGSLLNDEPDVRAVNVSLGYNWAANAGIDADTNTTAQRIANRHGALFGLGELIRVALGGDLPVVVAAAGNDSNHPSLPAGAGTQDARYSSPFANAALEHDVANVIVVESLANATGSAGGATRSGFSNVNGHLSAPGSGVVSTIRSDGYDDKSGTSMAAPHVTGLVSYLYSLDPDLPRPTLTDNRILDILESSAMPVAGGASNRVDAYSAALELDAYRGFPNVVDQLVDVDDGTGDGNRRLQFGSGVDFAEEDADADGGVGDGEIDMADFRRWRDWLLQSEDAAGLELDGTDDHPKKDVNGNGSVEAAADENLFPRGDFNGDGQLSRDASALVPGQFDAAMTDLEVLQSRFDDPHYDAADLPDLLDTGDVQIRATSCLDPDAPEIGDVATVRSSISVSGESATLAERTHATSATDQVYTVAAGETYDVRADALDDAGQSVGHALATFTVALGGDAYWLPECTTEPVGEAPDVTITVPPEDIGNDDQDYTYDGFDDDLNMWFKDVTLEGEAVDTEDGALTGDALRWTTNRSDLQDQNLGTGGGITARLYSDVCQGVEHQVTLTATDSDGNPSSTTRRIFIWTLC